MLRRSRRRFAHLVHEVLDPFLLVAILLVQVAVLTDPAWWWAALVSVVFLTTVPWATSLLLVRRGAATDRFIRHRTQRHLFYALALGSTLLGLAALMVLPTSVDVRLAAGLAAGTLLIVMAVNTRIKISIHALATALVGLVVPAGLPGAAWWVLGAACWLLACWARVEARRHTVVEVVLGSLLGAGVGAAFLIAAPLYPG